MKFKRFKANSARTEVFINLTPLIDVIFVLLLFFVVSTTFTKPSQLKINLPEASSTNMDGSDAQMLEISINAEGTYLVNGQALARQDAESLQEALRQQAEGDFAQLVVITADAHSSHQNVVTAMDVAGKLGFSKLRITTINTQ